MKNLVRIDPHIRIAPESVPCPIIIRVTKFDGESAEKFSEQISKAHNTGQNIVPIIIDSYGGEVYSLLSMISDIESATIPIATIAVGKAMSCGSILLSCGAAGQRYMDANAIVMIHDVFNFSCGKTEEVKADAKETDRISQQIFHKMARKCGHKDKNYFLKLIHQKSHADWYLTPSDAKKHRLVNYIRVPSFVTTISLKIDME